MADAVASPGRIIAVDGSRGRDVAEAAAVLAEELRGRGVTCGISRWDASGIFHELAFADRGESAISPRTLTLAYIADLAFRLRWEITPVLHEGGIVIAAPYLETAVALATACRLPEAWVRDVMRFAPPPAVRTLTRERKASRGWKPRLDRGYPEYCAALLEATHPGFAVKPTRLAMMAGLAQKRGRSKVWVLSEKDTPKAAKAIIDSLQAAAARSASPRRTGRS